MLIHSYSPLGTESRAGSTGAEAELLGKLASAEDDLRPIPWRQTLSAVAAAPYLAVAVARPLLAQLAPMRWVLGLPPMPGAPRADAIDRTLPREQDGEQNWRARERVIMGDLRVAELGKNPWLYNPAADSNAAWLADQDFRLVAGAGFVGIYQHLGRLLALDDFGLRPAEMVGFSSGSIALAMVGCLGLEAARHQMMRLSAAEFLDPTFAGAWCRGGACRGLRLQAKLEQTLAPGGIGQIEDVRPHLQVAVYNRVAQQTELHPRGPLALRVRQGAALPLLFELGEYIDGGWMDQHGRLAMLPGQRCLGSRLRAGEPGMVSTAIGRGDPILSISADAEHLTLCVQPKTRLTETNFIWMLDRNKFALKRIIDESRRLTLAWLSMPRTSFR